MGLQPIPTAWRKAVCDALRYGTKKANFTHFGGQRWQNEFPAAFRCELDEAFIRALSDSGAMGCLVQMAHPPGETWEFYFPFHGHKLYGKIMLRTNGHVLIFSAHRPGKAKLRYE